MADEDKSVRVFGEESGSGDAWTQAATDEHTSKALRTQQADVDAHDDQQSEWFVPPYDLAQLNTLLERHETHAACVQSKAKNVAGFGFDLVPHRSAESDEPGGREQARQFWYGPESTFQLGPDNKPAAPHDVLEHSWIDHEAIGWCAIEVLANPASGEPTGLATVPAHTIRRRKNAPGYVQLDDEDEPARYFGAAGDRYQGGTTSAPPPEGSESGGGSSGAGQQDRQIFVDAETGEWGENAGAANVVANELLTLRNYAATAPHYGTPDIIPGLQTMQADVAARRHNTNFFENDAVPRFMVIVEGAELSERAWDDLQERFQTLKGEGESHRGMLLEAQNMVSAELSGDAADVNIRIEPISVGLEEDADFMEFRRENEHHIMQAHSVPPVVVGRTESVNYASSKSQRKEFAQTVIRPRQERFAARLYDVLHRVALGVPGWTIEFRLHGGENQLQQSEVALNNARAIKAMGGPVTVNEAREKIGLDALTDENGNPRPEGQMLLASLDSGSGVGTTGGGADETDPEAAAEEAARNERNRLAGYSMTDRAGADD